MSICEHLPHDLLCDGGLPRLGWPRQPVDRGLVENPCPEFDLAQGGSMNSLQIIVAVPVAIQPPPCSGNY